MPLPHAEKLIETAQKGHKLTHKDRLHVITYLLMTKPEVRPMDMAELFQVSVRQIQLDRRKLREDKANAIKLEDPALVLADIALSFEQQVRDMEASKAKSRLGTAVYLSHCNTIFITQIKKIEAMQSLGYYPKNLGNLTTDKFVWQADVTSDGTVNTRPVNLKFKKNNHEVVDVPYEDVSDSPAMPSDSVLLPATLSVEVEPADEQV